MRTFALALALLALTSLTRADDVDPEPPGQGVRQLLGKWESTKNVSKGVERPFTTTSYHFERDKVTCKYGAKSQTTQERTYKIDARRRAVLMTYHGTTRTHFYKIEKGELYLSIDRSKDPDAKKDPNVKPDFTGKTTPVLILKKVK
jgi:hypothetical protein